MFARLSALTAALALALSAAGAAHAENTAAPKGEVVLTVTLNKGDADAGTQIQYDRDSLAALGLETFETTTIWTDGPQTFEGVPLSALVEALEVEEGKLLATATNDYTVEVPVSDAVEGGPMIAMTLNGATMSLRDKGPLWIVYPYDTSADYRTEVIYSRSIWQLDRIEVVE